MDEADFVTGLHFNCPRCGQAEADNFEVIEARIPAVWRCTSCARPFSVLLVECLACGIETVDVALQANEHTAVEELLCSGCGRRQAREDEVSEETSC